MNKYAIKYRVTGCTEPVTQVVEAESIVEALDILSKPYENMGHYLNFIDIDDTAPLVDGQVFYNYEDCPHPYKVCFLNEAGVELTKGFVSPFNTARFVKRLMHSKTCELKIYPSFAVA